jgi:hypothetical protein
MPARLTLRTAWAISSRRRARGVSEPPGRERADLRAMRLVPVPRHAGTVFLGLRNAARRGHVPQCGV